VIRRCLRLLEVFCIGWIAIAAHGCHRYRLTIEISDISNGSPMFRFTGPWYRSQPWATDVVVEDSRTEEPVCSLHAGEAVRRGIESWRYGDRIAGFSLTGCQPLRRGRYRVQVKAPAALGFEEFVVASVLAPENPDRGRPGP
jgi:hypothetical protein